jgi:hypothetical protein
LLLYSSKSSLGVYQLAGLLLQANKFSGTIITAPSVFSTLLAFLSDTVSQSVEVVVDVLDHFFSSLHG